MQQWATRIVKALLRHKDDEAVALAEAKDADYDEVKRRLARVEARLRLLGVEGDVIRHQGEPTDARAD